VATSPNLRNLAQQVLSSSPTVYQLLQDSSEFKTSSEQTPHQQAHLLHQPLSSQLNPLVPLPANPYHTRLTMTESKMIEFGGTSTENVEHFLYGFEIFFQNEERRAGADGVRESSEAKAYYVIRHIKPRSAASRFVNRLPLQVTRDYAALCRELRSRFENSTELEEEKRRAEESFLNLRQKSSQSIVAYIKLTKKIASRMSSENQHLVATQFIKGLDSRELRIQAMSGLSNRPSVEEAITKVQRLWDIMSEDNSSEDEDDVELTDSETESDKDQRNGKSSRRRRSREKEIDEEKKRKRSEKMRLSETGKIRKDLEALKELLTKNQVASYGQGGLPKPISIPENQDLPAIEAYSMGNRLAPPIRYGTQPRPRFSSYHPAGQGRDLPWGDRFTEERGNRPQWGQARDFSEQWQESGTYGHDGNRRSFGQPHEFSQYAPEDRIPYQRRDRSQLVCYQCGIVGHLRYECHLLRPTGQAQGPQQNSTSNQYLRSSYSQQEGERDRAKRGEGQERPTWGTRLPANAGSRDIHQSSAVNGMVVELIHPFVRNVQDSDTSHDSVGETSPEVMAGERARLRSELTESSGSQERQPPRQRQRSLEAHDEFTQIREQKRLPVRRTGHKPIRLMAGHPGFDFVSGFRDAQVTGLTWGQFFDLSPEGKRQFVKLMVQERPRTKGIASKGKTKAKARVVESILSEAALVGKTEPSIEVTNFYTTAKICLKDRVFEIEHVLIDAGSVVNLAPISVLRAMGATLIPTKDLVIRTAASNLVPLDFYADLRVDVASVITSLRVFAMPASCEPTYGLLLSRGWLRVCQAVGDYAEDVYMIKDLLGREYRVPREGTRTPRAERTKVYIRQGNGMQASLDEDLIAELELEERESFEEIVRHVMNEARSELAVFQTLEEHGEDESLTDSEELEIQEVSEASDGGYESDWSWQGSEEEQETERKLTNSMGIKDKMERQLRTSKSKN